MEINDIEQIDRHNIKIRFVNEDVEEILVIVISNRDAEDIYDFVKKSSTKEHQVIRETLQSLTNYSKGTSSLDMIDLKRVINGYCDINHIKRIDH